MRNISSNDELMTTRQVGEVLGVAVRTVQLWVESGVLPAWRTAGGHRRIARSAVEKLMAERSQVIAQVAVTQKKPVDAADRPLVLLVVDDDPDQLRLFLMMAESWDFPVEVLTAPNGFEGLLSMGRLQPDLVLTDLNMPGMDGFQMVRALKRPGSGFGDLRIVVVTAYSNAEIQERGGLPADVIVYQKPTPFREIEAKCRELQARLATGSLAQT